jgi:putative nucleotidyltransferase with HDIG domain
MRYILRKINSYKPQGHLADTARLWLALSDINHKSTKEHCIRVALLSEKVAKQMRRDCKAAFFGGLLHDFGKVTLPYNLFDGHDVSDKEFNEIKTHSKSGYKVLKNLHFFVALCAGLHHNLYKGGYGISKFPHWSPATIKKVLDISVIISIADFVDAWTTRKTKLKGGGEDLQKVLYEKFPNDKEIVDKVIKKPRWKFHYPELGLDEYLPEKRMSYNVDDEF